MRQRTAQPEHDGQPCPAESETQSCNIQACNEDCVLGDWEDWSQCGRACDTGHRERRMPVKIPARGQGKCPPLDSKQRLVFEECNKVPCMSLLPANETKGAEAVILHALRQVPSVQLFHQDSPRTILNCRSKVDAVFLVDGSGSIPELGFVKSKEMLGKLVTGLLAGESQAALMVFGGPLNSMSLEKCTGSDLGIHPDVQNDCGMRWVSRFTDSRAELSQKLTQVPHPESTTMISMALAEAKSQLENGRPDAESVVIIVTDAKPMSIRKTTKAAQDLMKTARLIWVVVGPEGCAGCAGIDQIDQIKAWASKPWQDNIVEARGYERIPLPETVNKILGSMCAVVE